MGLSGFITRILADTTSGTFDPLKKHSIITLSNGNRKATRGNTGDTEAAAALGLKTRTLAGAGKWYFEFQINTLTAANFNAFYVGFGRTNEFAATTPNAYSADVGGQANSVGYGKRGNVGNEGAFAGDGTYASYVANDVIGVAIDFDSASKTFRFYKNGTAQAAATVWTPAAGNYCPAFNGRTNNDAVTLRTIASQFTQAIPSGFSAWG